VIEEGGGGVRPPPGGPHCGEGAAYRPRVDGSPVPLGSTAAHDPTRVKRAAWARRKSLGVITNNHKISRMSA